MWCAHNENNNQYTIEQQTQHIEFYNLNIESLLPPWNFNDYIFDSQNQVTLHVPTVILAEGFGKYAWPYDRHTGQA